jgi:hypothetical protein
MTIDTSASLICIACHANSAEHFASFKLANPQANIKIYSATGSTLKKFETRLVEVAYTFPVDQPSQEEAEKIAKTCQTAFCVITDVGYLFSVEIQKALLIHAEKVRRVAYYDNPEPFIPGYSKNASETIELAHDILLANPNLYKQGIFSKKDQLIPLDTKKIFAVGYYHKDYFTQIALKRRTSKEDLTRNFLFEHGLYQGHKRKLFFYFGGSNTPYYEKAFPAFINFIGEAQKSKLDLRDYIFVIQKHLQAKEQKKEEQIIAKAIKERRLDHNNPPIVISKFSQAKAQVVADAAFYYQSPQGPQFALEGIQPIFQIGHKKYEDILVRNGIISSITTPQEFIYAFQQLNENPPEPYDKQKILNLLGYNKHWNKEFLKAIFPMTPALDSIPELHLDAENSEKDAHESPSKDAQVVHSTVNSIPIALPVVQQRGIESQGLITSLMAGSSVLFISLFAWNFFRKGNY